MKTWQAGDNTVKQASFHNNIRARPRLGGLPLHEGYTTTPGPIAPAMTSVAQH